LKPGYEWFSDHASSFRGELRWDESLARHTYYRIGGPAPLLAIPKGEDDLRWLRTGLDRSGCNWVVLGLGSNLLVSDSGFPGLVIKTSRLDQEIEGHQSQGWVRTGCSVAVSSLLRRAGAEGWSGFECLAGVPGSVGGVVVMNAGTHLGEAKDRIQKVRTFDLNSLTSREWSPEEMSFEYRRNLFLPAGSLVTSVDWRISWEDPSMVTQRIDETLERRKATQPVDYPSCGSVFKNPESSGLRAWQVVDKLGLRGHRIGNAQFAEKHSNFIINLGGARAIDVRSLIDLAKARAMAELKIELEEEVKFLGSF
jgi:UDP-N-acetylmuramate dehydrogenase